MPASWTACCWSNKLLQWIHLSCKTVSCWDERADRIFESQYQRALPSGMSFLSPIFGKTADLRVLSAFRTLGGSVDTGEPQLSLHHSCLFFQGSVTFLSGFVVNSSMLEVHTPQRWVLQDTSWRINGTFKWSGSGAQQLLPLVANTELQGFWFSKQGRATLDRRTACLDGGCYLRNHNALPTFLWDVVAVISFWVSLWKRQYSPGQWLFGLKHCPG